jgi:hypothetical protein
MAVRRSVKRNGGESGSFTDWQAGCGPLEAGRARPRLSPSPDRVAGATRFDSLLRRSYLTGHGFVA